MARSHAQILILERINAELQLQTHFYLCIGLIIECFWKHNYGLWHTTTGEWEGLQGESGDCAQLPLNVNERAKNKTNLLKINVFRREKKTDG